MDLGREDGLSLIRKSNRNDDLPDVRVGFHVAMSLHDFCEGKRLRDSRFKQAFANALQHILFGSLELLCIKSDLEEYIALHGQVLTQDGK